MSTYSDNDDDLFQDIPPAPNSFFQEEPQTASSINDEAVNQLLDSTKDYINSRNLGIDSFKVRTGIPNSFLEACNQFIFRSDTFNRSVFDVLNQYTNGEFSKILYYNFLEESIIKRFSIRYFLHVLVNEPQERLLSSISENLHSTIDQTYLRIYFGSTLKVMDHAINRSIEIYQKLCTELGREPMQAIIDREYSSPSLRTISSSSYILNSFTSLNSSLGFKTY